VRAGEPILILGDVGVDADRNRLGYRVAVEKAALVRHEAEQARAPQLVFPEELVAAGREDERVAEALAKETNLFKARRDALNSETTLLQAQYARVREEINALNAQIEQAGSSLDLQRKELQANRELTANGFISQTRLGQIEATVSDYASKVAERRSELARAQQRLVDTQIKMTSLQNEYVRTASDQHKATAARLGELEQEVRKTEDAVTRQVVAAPADGEIIDLRITSPGAVVRPGETVAEVVPKGAQLLVEARIRPEDVSNVHVGQVARLRLTAYRWRNSAFLHGKVTYVSADRLTDKSTNAPYYGVVVVADNATEGADLQGMKLQAGMPAEVYLEGAKQTALAYLLEPITATLRKAGRQL
jgi:HlyD family secretion protein